MKPRKDHDLVTGKAEHDCSYITTLSHTRALMRRPRQHPGQRPHHRSPSEQRAHASSAECRDGIPDIRASPPRTRRTPPVPHQDFSDLYEKMSGKGENAGGARQMTARQEEDVAALVPAHQAQPVLLRALASFLRLPCTFPGLCCLLLRPSSLLLQAQNIRLCPVKSTY